MVGECPAAYARDIDLRGVVLVDVSENGGASDALRATETFLAKRPKGFATKTDAVAWFVRSGMTTNLASARVSAPSQIRRATGTEENQGGRANESRDSRFVWILDARATAPHWRGWFEGLSRTFLSAKCAKLLVLAGVDRLDDELTIAQMRASFRLFSSRARGTPSTRTSRARRRMPSRASSKVRARVTPRTRRYLQ